VKESHAKEKHSTIDKKMVGHRAPPIILVRSPTEIERGRLRGDTDCTDDNRKEDTTFQHAICDTIPPDSGAKKWYTRDEKTLLCKSASRVTPRRAELCDGIDGNVRKLPDKCSVGIHNEIIWIVKDGQRVQVGA
jgi:hypothetical protein